MLTLPEELLLLSLDDKGHTHDVVPANLDVGLLAASIYELELRGRVDIDGPTLAILDDSHVGDPELDETVKLIVAHQGKDLETLLTSQYGQLGWVRKHVMEGLVAKGELRAENEMVLWLLPQRRYAVEHGAEELSLLERLLRTLVLGEEPGRRTAALLTLVASVFTSDHHLKERLFAELRDRMYEVVNSGGETQAQMRDSVCAALANTAPPFMP